MQHFLTSLYRHAFTCKVCDILSLDGGGSAVLNLQICSCEAGQADCVAGQYIAFDSTHIWETGIQTYVAAMQHLQATPSSACNLNTSSLPNSKATQPISAPQLMTHICTDTPSTQQPSEITYNTDATGISMHTQPTAEHTPAKSNITGKPSSPQRLLLVLALHDDTWLKSFIAEVSEPELWQIHVWQAADGLSGHSSHALRETLSSFHSKGGLEPTFYNTAAGKSTILQDSAAGTPLVYPGPPISHAHRRGLFLPCNPWPQV